MMRRQPQTFGFFQQGLFSKACCYVTLVLFQRGLFSPNQSVCEFFKPYNLIGSWFTT